MRGLTALRGFESRPLRQRFHRENAISRSVCGPIRVGQDLFFSDQKWPRIWWPNSVDGQNQTALESDVATPEHGTQSRNRQRRRQHPSADRAHSPIRQRWRSNLRPISRIVTARKWALRNAERWSRIRTRPLAAHDRKFHGQDDKCRCARRSRCLATGTTARALAMKDTTAVGPIADTDSAKSRHSEVREFPRVALGQGNKGSEMSARAATPNESVTN